MKVAVTDASFCLCFLLPDEFDAHVNHQFIEYQNGDLQLVAPHLLPFEIANALLVGIHRKRLTFAQAQDTLKRFLSIGIVFLEVDFGKALSISDLYQLSLYDASYVELAIRKKYLLFTLDKKVKRVMDSLDNQLAA